MKKTTQRGQSITEFLVALAFLAPVVLFIPTLANMLSLQTEAYKASRYAAWERTAYTGTNLKSSTQIASEVKSRFLQYGDQGFDASSTNQSQTMRKWTDFKNKISMVNPNQPVGTKISNADPMANTLNASASLGGFGGQNDPQYAVQLNTMQTAHISLPLRNNISLLQARKAVDAWHTKLDTGNNPAPPVDPVTGTNQFYIGASSALIADGWGATNEQMFHDRVAGETAAAEGGLRFWEGNALIRTLGGMFREIPQHLYTGSTPQNSLGIVDPNQSLNLPDYVKK